MPITKSHSTAIDAVRKIYDRLITLEHVKRMSFGIISQCKTIRGNRRVKIMDDQGALLLKVRDISSIQELRVYLDSTETILDEIKEQLTNMGFDIS